MSLIERLRRQARDHASAIWYGGGYNQDQEDMRALLTEAADALEAGALAVVGFSKLLASEDRKHG